MRGRVGPKRLLTQLLHTLSCKHTYMHTRALTAISSNHIHSVTLIKQIGVHTHGLDTQTMSHKFRYHHTDARIYIHTYKHACSCQLAAPQPCPTDLRSGEGKRAPQFSVVFPLLPPPISFLYGGRPQRVQLRLVGKNLCTAKSAVASLGYGWGEIAHCRGKLKGCSDVGTEPLLNLRRPRPRAGRGGNKGPWIWHLQIEDQVVEALFRDAVVETYCRDREVIRSGR